MYKLYLTDEEFDKLPDQSQRDFFYCPICGLYYYWKEVKVCNHGK